MMGDLLGAYTIGSGAEWTAGTDYRVQISAMTDKTVVDQSDADFEITTPPPTVTVTVGSDGP